MTSTTDDARLARVLADAAAETLIRTRATGLTGRDLRDAGDRAAQEVLADRLRSERPGDAVLSEEAADPAARLTSGRVWIIDPLDGTREFSEPPRDDWAVHVALWTRDPTSTGDDGELAAGAVALPARGTTYGTDAPPAVPVRRPGPLRLAVSRSRPPAFVVDLAERLGAQLVPMGSAGVKCACVWTGEVDAYLHGGGQYEWDSAAPVAVARAAGLHASRLDGAPLRYNRPDPLLPDLLVCRPELASTLLPAVAGVRSEPRTERAEVRT